MSSKYKPKQITPTVTLVACKLSKDGKSFVPIFTPLDTSELEEHKKDPWSKEEDSLLLEMAMRSKKWTLIAREINTNYHNGILIRNQKQCRERWKNFIDPDLKKKPFSKKEDELLVLYYEKYKSWAKVAKKLKHRNENQVKNRYRALKSGKCIKTKPDQNYMSQFTNQFNNFPNFPSLENVSISNYLSPANSALIKSIPLDQAITPLSSEFPSFTFQGEHGELFGTSFGNSLVSPAVSFFHETKKYFQNYGDNGIKSNCDKILDNFCDQNLSNSII